MAKTREQETSDLKSTVETMSMLSVRGFERISTLACLALAAMESPRGFDGFEAIARALQIILEEAETSENEISAEAASVGCNFCDTEEQRRRADRAAVRESYRQNWLLEVDK